jgi:hypothetical protein
MRLTFGAAVVGLAAIMTPLSAQRRLPPDGLGGPQGRGRGPMSVAAERVQARSYRFTDTNKKLEYAVFVSSHINKQALREVVWVI